MLGVEGDYDGAGINGSQQATFNSLLVAPGFANSGFMVHENIDSLASIRGRLGYTWGPGLLYVTGGGAWEHMQTNAIISGNVGINTLGNTGTGNFSNTRSGYVVGGGVEWMVAQNWTVRAEYLYYDFNGGGGTGQTVGIPNCSTGPGAGFGASGVCGAHVASANNNVNVFRLGASYKFDWFR